MRPVSRFFFALLIVVAATPAFPAEKDFRVAVLIFDHAEDIDFTAPIEVLGNAGAHIFTVAATKDPITTVFGLHITPDYDLTTAPDADLILVPGGGIGKTARNDQVIAWLQQRAPNTKYVMSVCNGAFILAKAGLLDGLKATTTASHIDELAETYPKVQALRERVVDNGKIITAGGLSAGIDGALHVIEREYGRSRAEDIALGIEYRWQPDAKWTRASLADTRLPDIKLPDDAKFEKLANRGDAEKWLMSGRLQIAMSEDDLLDYATKEIVARGWTLRETTKGKRVFVKKDREGQTWQTTLTSKPDTSPSTYMETMTIRKVNG
jgi:putative intracellular protease/amidase